jgi:hypothetical protein
MPVPTPRLLDLVIDGSDDFFQRLPSENFGGPVGMMPLSIRIPVVAGVASVLKAPEYWAERLIGAVMPAYMTDMVDCMRSIASIAPRQAGAAATKFSSLRQS